jgi:hypothetical protein
MIIIYDDDLISLSLDEYKNVEIVNCYINEENQSSCLKIIANLKNAKTAYVATRKRFFYKSFDSTTYISKNIYPTAKFGYTNYLSKDKKVLVIEELSLCETKCKNCIPCFNIEYLTSNPEVETLIINKVGSGANAILNNLPHSLIHLRVGESVEEYELNNLPFSLQKLELYDQLIIDSTKIKLPIDCVLSLISPIN